MFGCCAGSERAVCVGVRHGARRASAVPCHRQVAACGLQGGQCRRLGSADRRVHASRAQPGGQWRHLASAEGASRRSACTHCRVLIVRRLVGQSTILLFRGDKGCFYPSVYVDAHGETDENLRCANQTRQCASESSPPRVAGEGSRSSSASGATPQWRRCGRAEALRPRWRDLGTRPNTSSATATSRAVE